jgi:hypothetical protein
VLVVLGTQPNPLLATIQRGGAAAILAGRLATASGPPRLAPPIPSFPLGGLPPTAARGILVRLLGGRDSRHNWIAAILGPQHVRPGRQLLQLRHLVLSLDDAQHNILKSLVADSPAGHNCSMSVNSSDGR